MACSTLVYSYLMFQHIPDSNIVETYLREVNRVLKPGAAFKFQIDGRGDRVFWRIYRAFSGHSSWRGALWTESGIVEALGGLGSTLSIDAWTHADTALMRYAYLWVTCIKRS